MNKEKDLIEKIIFVIENDISPIIGSHGGNIRFKSFKDGTVTITLGGNCRGCMSAQITAEEVVKEKLLEKIGNEIKKVSVYQEIDNEIWEFAKGILRGEKSGLERRI